ncbi:multidrug ABC transporter ATP-binding protein [Ectothiorhodospira shaposhnikovii]|nr:multidrug ABC transporter ATP-binding protein [Ectothiorhodospira shaposhnikovii]
MNRVIRAGNQRPRRFYWGLSLRVLERIFSIAPFFLAYVWLDDLLQKSGTGLEFAEIMANDGQILTYGMALGALLAGQLLFSYLGQLQSFTGAYELTGSYRETLIDHVRRLPLGTLQQESSGRLASVLTDDVNRVEKIFTHLTAEWVAAVAVPLLFVIALVWIDWRLTLSLLVTLPLAVAALNAARRFFLARADRKQEQFLDVSGLLVEFITGIRTLRLFNRAKIWWERLDRRFEAIRHSSMGVEAWAGGSVQLYRLCLELGLVALLLCGAWLAKSDGLAPLHWLLFAMVAYKLLDPLLDAAAFLTEMRAMARSEARVQALFDRPPLPESSAPTEPDGFELAFEGVSFRYDTGTAWALRDVSFRAPQGRIVAVVGPSGGGKSTLLNLLARFFDPQEGRITLGGVDLRDLGPDQLYDYLSFVFQDVQLFDGSVLENVRIGCPEATDAEVMDACRAAWCDEFIQRLPQGYETLIGENGQRLSGGQRQRLSIARALLKDAPVLLLDESTASVDPETQHEIQGAISRLIKGRTVIVIAHRLHTIQHADQILLLTQGRIIERGSHAELLGAGGLYRDMWALQTITQ